MEHKALHELDGEIRLYVAEKARHPLSQRERLERWASLLDQQPDRRLRTLQDTEYRAPAERETLRCNQSPLSVAFEDPILRLEGLDSDTYGAAKRFFDISDWQLHSILCFCHHGATLSAETAAWRVRAAIPKTQPAGLFARLVRFLTS